jgi:AraC-like DNA-binding protein
MALSTLCRDVEQVHQAWVVLQRDYSPDQPRDGYGRFAPGSGKYPNLTPERMTPKQLAQAHAAVNPNGPTSQCAHCTRMNNGPLVGQRLGFQMTLPGVHINDSVCPECLRQQLSTFFQKRGVSETEAEKEAMAVARSSYTDEELRKLVDDPATWGLPTSDAEQRTQYLRALAERVLTNMQQAEQMRNFTYTDSHGNVHMVTQGSGGQWTDNQIIEYAHTGWEGVTHQSAHAGKSAGGGKSTGEDPRITEQRARITAAKAEIARLPRSDGTSWNYYQRQISDAETHIAQMQRENGIAEPSKYPTKMTDVEFRVAFMRAVAEHEYEHTGFAKISDLQKLFKHAYGMSPKEFSARMNAMREGGDRGEHPYHLHYEADEERLHLRSPHFWQGQQFDFVEAVDKSAGGGKGINVEKDYNPYQAADLSAYHRDGGDALGTRLMGFSATGLRAAVDRHNAEHPDDQITVQGRSKDALLKSITDHFGTTGKATGGAKSAGEDIHAKSARLQQEQGLPAEQGSVRNITELEHVTDKVSNLQFNPYQVLDVNTVRDVVGERQLGAALNTMTSVSLRHMARAAGIDTKGIANNKSELVSRLTAHATEGRYSADFRNANEPASAKATPATEHPFADEYRQRLTALQEEADRNGYHAANPAAQKALAAAEKAAAPKSTSGGRQTVGAGKAQRPRHQQDDLVPIRTGVRNPWSETSAGFNATVPPNPSFLRELYGDGQLHAALDRYPVGRLKETVARLLSEGYTVKVGRTKEETIQNLIAFTKNPQQRAALPDLAARLDTITADLLRVA